MTVKRKKIDEELIALDFSGDLKSVNRPVYFRLPEGKAAALRASQALNLSEVPRTGP